MGHWRWWYAVVGVALSLGLLFALVLLGWVGVWGQVAQFLMFIAVALAVPWAIGRRALADLPGQAAAGLRIEAADEFAYDDPVDGSRSEGQGLRIMTEGGGRIVLRLSGTGTEGATLRVYLERVETDPARMQDDPQQALAGIVAAAEEIAGIHARTGRDAPDVIT